MKIEEIIESKKVVSHVPKIEECSCVTVVFQNKNKLSEEIQLTVTNHLMTKAGTKELSELFSSLVKELNTNVDSVEDVIIVASAQTTDILEELGY